MLGCIMASHIRGAIPGPIEAPHLAECTPARPRHIRGAIPGPIEARSRSLAGPRRDSRIRGAIPGPIEVRCAHARRERSRSHPGSYSRPH